MKNKRWPIILTAAALCLIVLVPALVFGVASTSAERFMRKLDVSEFTQQPDLVYHSWDWQWGSDIILVTFVDKANVLQDSFGPHRTGVAWSLKKFAPRRCRFTADAVN